MVRRSPVMGRGSRLAGCRSLTVSRRLAHGLRQKPNQRLDLARLKLNLRVRTDPTNRHDQSLSGSRPDCIELIVLVAIQSDVATVILRHGPDCSSRYARRAPTLAAVASSAREQRRPHEHVARPARGSCGQGDRENGCGDQDRLELGRLAGLYLEVRQSVRYAPDRVTPLATIDDQLAQELDQKILPLIQAAVVALDDEQRGLA
jgi:hypothetical protein